MVKFSIEENFNLVDTYNNIGNAYYIKGEYDTALEYYNLCLDTFKFPSDILLLADIYMHIGNVY